MKRKRNKHKVVLTICGILTLLVSSGVFAATDNYNVSETCPLIISNEAEGNSTYSTSTPDTSNTLNLSTYGQYDFTGSANRSSLFTDYAFKGTDSVDYYVRNNNPNQRLIVKIKQHKWYGETTYQTLVDMNSSALAGEGGNFKIASDAIWYLEFLAPSDFSGYVR